MINITGWYHIVIAWLTIVAKLSLNRNFRVNQILKIFSEYDLDNYCLFLPQGGIPILRNKITWRTTEAQGCNWTILYDYEVIWTVYNPFLQPFWSILVYLGLPWATSGYLDLTRAITAISVYLGPSCSVSGYFWLSILQLQFAMIGCHLQLLKVSGAGNFVLELIPLPPWVFEAVFNFEVVFLF